MAVVQWHHSKFVLGAPRTFLSLSESLSSFKFVQHAPQDASLLHQSAFWLFKVNQGRWFWYQLKAHMRLHISRSLWL